jgi:hypothetical protein
VNVAEDGKKWSHGKRGRMKKRGHMVRVVPWFRVVTWQKVVAQLKVDMCQKGGTKGETCVKKDGTRDDFDVGKILMVGQ